MGAQHLKWEAHINLFRQGDILFCRPFHPTCHLSELSVQNYLEEIEVALDGRLSSLVLDFRKFVGTLNPLAARLFAGQLAENKLIFNQAFVTDNLNGKLLVGLYIRLYGEMADIKHFHNMEKAMAYCLHIQENGGACK